MRLTRVRLRPEVCLMRLVEAAASLERAMKELSSGSRKIPAVSASHGSQMHLHWRNLKLKLLLG